MPRVDELFRLVETELLKIKDYNERISAVESLVEFLEDLEFEDEPLVQDEESEENDDSEDDGPEEESEDEEKEDKD